MTVLLETAAYDKAVRTSLRGTKQSWLCIKTFIHTTLSICNPEVLAIGFINLVYFAFYAHLSIEK